MFNRKEKVLALTVLVVFALVGLGGYSLSQTPAAPKKVWFETKGGHVIFDHAYHLTLAECQDCHHEYDPKQQRGTEMNCRSCHYFGEARDSKSDDPTHPHFIGANCVECHKAVKMDITCDTCHIRPGYAFEEASRVMPPIPEKVSFETDNGPVLFDHKNHVSKDISPSCVYCHHECKGGKVMKGMPCEKNCRSCHYNRAYNIPKNKDENHQRHIGASCAECHDAEKCELCHKG
jgi:hypothetical protein